MLNSDKYYNNKKITDMFKVEAQLCPNMTVHINSGTIIFKNKIINFSEQISEIINAPRIGTWLVLLSINEHGEIVYTYGIQSTEEKYHPTMPDACFHLCLIEVSATTTMITNDMISDLRQVYHFSGNADTMCNCKCSVADLGFTEEDRAMLTDFYNKYYEMLRDIDKIKLQLQPQKVYTVLTDGGIEYEIRFKNDGTPYFTRQGYEDELVVNETKQEYKFIYNQSTINLVGQSKDGFVNLSVKLKSYDSLNENINCTLFIRCTDTTIYCANYHTPYQETEFRYDNLQLTKSGFTEQFALKFHNKGNHNLKMLLYNRDTGMLIDSAVITYDVEFIDADIEL